MKSKINLNFTYPYSIEEVWEALTDKAALSEWLMDTSDFEAKVGAKFQFRAEASKHWRGYVDCVVLEVQAPNKIRYSWVGDEKVAETEVVWTLQTTPTGTKVTLSHTGFSGFRGLFLTKLILGPGWKKMMKNYIPTVLAFMKKSGKNFPADGLLEECTH